MDYRFNRFASNTCDYLISAISEYKAPLFILLPFALLTIFFLSLCYLFIKIIFN